MPIADPAHTRWQRAGQSGRDGHADHTARPDSESCGPGFPPVRQATERMPNNEYKIARRFRKATRAVVSLTSEGFALDVLREDRGDLAVYELTT